LPNRRRRILAGIALGSVLIAGTVVALPWTHDLDNQPSIKPQEMVIPPPEFSVPVTGREFPKGLEVESKLQNPVPADEASIARGQANFEVFCTPCHGPTGEGGGEVVKRGFVAATNLLSEVSRGRSDGHIYSYIRNGGPLMPPYRFGLKPEEAWDLVNYVRHIQSQAGEGQ
jgi:mono/diheme cytochrome c family protein